MQQRFRHQFLRRIYIPTQKHAFREKEISQYLHEIKSDQQRLQTEINKDKERKAVSKLAKGNINQPSPKEDVVKLDLHLQQPPQVEVDQPHKSSAIPNSIKQLVQVNKSDKMLFSQPLSIHALVNGLPVLSDISNTDIEMFVSGIPLSKRTQLVSKLEQLIPNNKRSFRTLHALMACHAELGDLAKVRQMFDLVNEPNEHTFGHLAKSMFKSKRPASEIKQLVADMHARGITPTLPVYTCLVQSYIQANDIDNAVKVFDSMKYWSVNTLPDIKLYNSMILAHGKRMQINKCLDLVEEMKLRRPYPLEPNAETYMYLVNALSKDPQMHYIAWELFLNNFLKLDFNKNTFETLMLLCAGSGEVLVARAVLSKLSSQNIRLVNQFMLNCLMKAYANFDPSTPSPILASPAGVRIRTDLLNFLQNFEADSPIPFLPLGQLTAEQVVLESGSVFEYFAHLNKDILTLGKNSSSCSNPTLFNFLKVALNHSNITEFKRRFYRFTVGFNKQRCLPPSTNEPLYSATQPHSKLTILREDYLYQLAMSAAIKFRNLEFGKEVWVDRGLYRRESKQFRQLSLEERNLRDFKFARLLIELLASCNEVEDAIMVLVSAKRLGRWKSSHVFKLIEKLTEIEDAQGLERVNRVLAVYERSEYTANSMRTNNIRTK